MKILEITDLKVGDVVMVSHKSFPLKNDFNPKWQYKLVNVLNNLYLKRIKCPTPYKPGELVPIQPFYVYSRVEPLGHPNTKVFK